MSTTFGWFPKPMRPTTHQMPDALGRALADSRDLIPFELDGMELGEAALGWLEGFAAASSHPLKGEVQSIIAAIRTHGSLVLVVES